MERDEVRGREKRWQIARWVPHEAPRILNAGRDSREDSSLRKT